MGILKSESFFKNVEFLPTNLTLGLLKALAEDNSSSKVNLCIGGECYRRNLCFENLKDYFYLSRFKSSL